MMLPRLNLPDYPLKVSSSVGSKTRVWDPLRLKYVALTPEEYVRQRFVAWLMNDLHYPRALLANEVALRFNDMIRRCDTLSVDRHGNPFMVVEYKAPDVSITQKVFDQIVRYNMVFRAPYIAVTNGLSHFCCHIDCDKGTYNFIPQIPDWQAAMAGPIDN